MAKHAGQVVIFLNKDLSLIARGAGFYFAGFAVSKVLAYVYKAMIARGLGPAEFGVFSIGVSIVGILTLLAALGLHSARIRNYSSEFKSPKILNKLIIFGP